MTALQDRIQGALAARFTIERELARGRATVLFVAADRGTAQRVALKVLRPELSAAVGAERFLRAVRLGGELDHPRIVPIVDSGELAGFLYLAMPYVDGPSLRQRLAREGALPIPDAVRIADEVADALSFAHRHDVLHRDIAPANILLSDHGAVVADFGIARALSDALGRITPTGVAVGTPPYTSPEQSTAGRDLDARSDLYSLGCVLYEMLAGHPPFTAPTPDMVLRMHRELPPPPLGMAREDVPHGLAGIVHRLLEKDREERYGGAHELRDALRLVHPRS